MTSKELRDIFLTEFDVVGIIDSNQYMDAAAQMNKDVPEIAYQTMVVLGLAYPKRILKHTKTHLVPSFYTFGNDYHQVLKARIQKVMTNLPYAYDMGVDNHPHDERLAATLAGVGYFGKNQLIINKDFGTYMFLGMVMIDVSLDQPFILEIADDCGTCRKCITACPPQALFDGGYDMESCMSHYNQSKRVLTDEEIDKNYSLFGCDICQLVCPKNINKGTVVHPEFELSGKEMVSIVELFSLSEKKFKQKYDNMAYLWKGKTILMRNALMVMLRQKNNMHYDLVKQSLEKEKVPWYDEMAHQILKKLEKV
ncbi:MAG: epoxyqueuosine reductase [Candidatus Izemoplasmataceae bacterium]